MHSLSRLPLRRLLIAVLLAAGLAACAGVPSATPSAYLAPTTGRATLQASREHYRAAAAAYASGDDAALLRHARAADALRPNHPTFVLTLAAAHARAGRADSALALLRHFADLGLTAGVAASDDFAGLRDQTDFSRVAARIAANGDPAGAAPIAFTLEERTFAPEGIAHDPGPGAFYVSSMVTGRIVRVVAGRSEAFAENAGWSAFGLAVDAARGRLWAALAVLDHTQGADPTRVGHTALVAFDLASGRRVREAVLDAGDHLFGSLALDPEGVVFATDSKGGGLYRLAPGAAGLEAVLPPGTFASPQGLAFSGDGRHLYVADYSFGVFRVDLKRRSTRLLPYPAGASLVGIDGLEGAAGDLVAVQNGVRPMRVLRLGLDRAQDRIERVEVLAAGHAPFDEPTLGTVVGRQFYVVTASPWAHLAGGVLDTASVSPPSVARIPLD